jgi:predicted regulator of Ras-like GTPase activity (Roadblock/LC7/MglB family)
VPAGRVRRIPVWDARLKPNRVETDLPRSGKSHAGGGASTTAPDCPFLPSHWTGGLPMFETQLVMLDEDYRRILAILQRLVRDANAKGIFLVDKNGQLIAEAGEMQGIDSTSLASLTAGSIAATGGLAKIVGEEEFPIHFHQGQRDNLHITLVGRRIILVVIFDERSSLGLVRLRVKKAGTELARVFEEIEKKAEREVTSGGSPFAEITDDDIDNLFAD